MLTASSKLDETKCWNVLRIFPLVFSTGIWLFWALKLPPFQLDSEFKLSSSGFQVSIYFLTESGVNIFSSGRVILRKIIYNCMQLYIMIHNQIYRLIFSFSGASGLVHLLVPEAYWSWPESLARYRVPQVRSLPASIYKYYKLCYVDINTFSTIFQQ